MLIGAGSGALGLNTSQNLSKTIAARLPVLKTILTDLLNEAGACLGILCTDAEDRDKELSSGGGDPHNVGTADSAG